MQQSMLYYMFHLLVRFPCNVIIDLMKRIRLASLPARKFVADIICTCVFSVLLLVFEQAIPCLRGPNYR